MDSVDASQKALTPEETERLAQLKSSFQPNIEIEAKFRVPSHKLIREKLEQLGAKHSRKVHETNLMFDDAHQRMRRNGLTLRLRKDHRVRLTYKGPQQGTQFKEREEREVEVSNFEQMATILQRLGFHEALRYTKVRETWHWRDVSIELDELDFGLFVELEGERENISAVAADLGLSLQDALTTGYAQMQTKWNATQAHWGAQLSQGKKSKRKENKKTNANL